MTREIWHLTLFVAFVALANQATAAERKGHYFPLFNVVQFDNNGCRSNNKIASSTSGNSYRNGTCYTANECESKGGTAAGSCAASFGVCCVFLVTTGTIRENCTYIRNAGFPSGYTGTSSATYTIHKCSDEVCYLRLDFETFNIQGPATTNELAGGICVDSMTAKVSTGQTVPVICGANSGHHIYLDVGRDSGASASLDFSFAGTSSNRMWEVKVTQVPCGSAAAPPNRCLQYLTGLTGTITTFNWLGTGNSEQHLANQDYSVCVRRERGYCCVRYQLCNHASAMSLHADVAMAKQDSSCTLDYVGIEGSSETCSQNTGVPLASRYCGTKLNRVSLKVVNGYICDCTSPFSVDIFTDAADDKGADTGSGTTLSKGLCLTYTQLPCSV